MKKLQLSVLCTLVLSSLQTYTQTEIEYSKPLVEIVPGLTQEFKELKDNWLAWAYLDLASVEKDHFFQSQFTWPTHDTDKQSLKTLLHLKAFQIVTAGMPQDNDAAAIAYNCGLFQQNNSIFTKDLTCTYLGKAALAQLLAYPLATAHEIIQRQQAMQELLNRHSLRRDLTTMLKEIHVLEPQMYQHVTEHSDESASSYRAPWINEVKMRSLQAMGIALPIGCWWYFLFKNGSERHYRNGDDSGFAATVCLLSFLGPVASW